MELKLNAVFSLLGIGEVAELNPTQRQLMRARHTSIFTSGILLSEDKIIFTNSEVHKNWCYYMGFEYVEQCYKTIIQHGEEFFLATYSTDCSRVSEVYADLTVVETANAL